MLFYNVIIQNHSQNLDLNDFHLFSNIKLAFTRMKIYSHQVWAGTPLVAQWLRFCAPNAGAQVPFLVRELDPT